MKKKTKKNFKNKKFGKKYNQIEKITKIIEKKIQKFYSFL
jgi:hypothetical protein